MQYNLKCLEHVSTLTAFCLAQTLFFRLIRILITTIDWIL
jgi:hypothetical protein